MVSTVCEKRPALYLGFASLPMILVLAQLLLSNAAAQSPISVNSDCGELDNAYGPFDYTNPRHVAEKLPIVEAHHFSPETEQLKGIVNKKLGKALGDRPLAGAIDYTLRAFPNHHRALYAMARYHIQKRHLKTPMPYTAECYFDRAFRFQPKDAALFVIAGYYKQQLGATDEAIRLFNLALSLEPAFAEAHYNLGLIYLEKGQLTEAQRHSEQAYELGFPLPWLKEELQRRSD